jgi:hypothetical protein
MVGSCAPRRPVERSTRQRPDKGRAVARRGRAVLPVRQSLALLPSPLSGGASASPVPAGALSLCKARHAAHGSIASPATIRLVNGNRNEYGDGSMHQPDSLSLGPDELSTISKAFDGAWEIACHGYDADDPIETDAGRVRLANVVLTAFRRGLTDPEELKAAALRMMGVPDNAE